MFSQKVFLVAIPGERGLYAKERVHDQLVFLGALHGLDRRTAASRADDLLARLGLTERRRAKLDELSLGNQQRVQLAASLVHDPAILVLDEPFSGLDPVAVDAMSQLLTERAAAGVPVLFSSHQLDLVQRLCDRVGIVAHGRMRAEGTVDELRDTGPVRFEVHTPVRDWWPQGTRVVDQHDGAVVLEAGGIDDQALLHAALAAGPVHSFTRRRPDLTDLFRETVIQA